MRISKVFPALVAAAGAVLSMPASALMLDFECISDNNATNCTAGEAQLRVEALDNGDGRARFVFTNVGTAASSITDVYFDDGTLLGISQVLNGGPGVDFSQNASPGNLPSGNSANPDFETTAGFSADSNPAVQPNGVNPGESLTILFFLQNGGSFADVLDELGDGRLRIGMHVQGFSSGGSESFVNMPSVPLPAAAWLLLSGIGALAAVRRTRTKTSALN